MKNTTLLFRDSIKALAQKWDFEFSDQIDSRRFIRIYFSISFPVWIDIEIDPNEENAFLIIRGRAHGIVGDKSDYHDLLSSILAIYFRLSNIASAYTIKYEYDFLPGEIYSFDILFHKQPPLTFIDINNPDIKAIEKLIVETSMVTYFIGKIWELSGEGASEEEYASANGIVWISDVVKKLKININSRNVNSYVRRFPSWEYLSITDRNIFVARLEIPIEKFIPGDEYQKNKILLDGIEGQIVESPTIKNTIPYKSLKIGREILKTLGYSKAETCVVPTENHLYLLADKVIIGIGSQCGLDEYRAEKERVLSRHQDEAKVLFTSIKFSWKNDVDDEEFEKLTVELLNREPGMFRARKIGKGNEPDFGRDILAEWYRPFMSEEEKPIRLQRVIVQCKAYHKPVNKSNVFDVVDLLHFHNSTGYLLVALSGITKPLIDFLEKIGERKNYWTDWWGRVEIEDRLRSNLDIAKRYNHIVEILSNDPP